MTYDPEKYRAKREKVLGFQRRGMSFGAIAAIVSICIVVSLGFVALPKTVAYISTRNLDDAIYKLENSTSWPNEIISGILEIEGVEKAMTDKGETRLVITFDRTEVDTIMISSFFRKKNVKSTLLNRISHRQRMKSLNAEKELEAS
jgi:hypothetical protein